MTKYRLDQLLVQKGLVLSRSQAESWVKLGKVFVDGKAVRKPGYFVTADVPIALKAPEQYVSRAGLKLASVAEVLGLEFSNKVVLDVGSSTGGFTDFALRRGAKKVIAVDVGTDQLHPSLRDNPAIELHEKTDIRDLHELSSVPNMVLIDVSFISLRDILPHIATLSGPKTLVVAMLKPQFEAGDASKHKGVIKNDAVRRRIVREFEQWVKKYFVIINKADSEVAGAKGNRERFYLLEQGYPVTSRNVKRSATRRTS
jgi:23S rRNA (cytidine1920-2'-O)/16S rRNA (cytidine1409-2'-O)-methyltransferase